MTMTPKQIEAVTKGMSHNAADMWKIAVYFANFEPMELLAEITRLQRVYRKVSITTVERAMGRYEACYRKAHPEEYIEIDRQRDEALVKLMGKR